MSYDRDPKYLHSFLALNLEAVLDATGSIQCFTPTSAKARSGGWTREGTGSASKTALTWKFLPAPSLKNIQKDNARLWQCYLEKAGAYNGVVDGIFARNRGLP